MASFTDQLTPFTPYVEQLPVEAMVNVGMQKQSQYDQGVQKIQAQMDNIAGMEIANESQRQYAQSKLDELGGKLKTVAAGDFSNQQLVNSVGGMATSIVKDPRIQNAVASTQRLKQGVADKTSANKAGKGSADNDWFFDQGANSYLNNKDVNASYSGGYIEYRDLQPKMIEALKSLHESGSDKEVPWETDADGNINYSKTAKAMVENGYKGISSTKIENAVRSSLDANDLRQLQISGMYQFRNYTPEDLAKHAQGEYEAGIKVVTDKIDALRKYAATNSGNNHLYNEALTTIKELQQQIGEGGVYKGTLTETLNKQLAAIAKDPNQAKADIYKNGMIKEFANAHSWEETALKYLNNPILDAEHWTSDFGIKQSTLALSQAEFKNTVIHQMVEESLGRDEYNLKYWTAHGGTVPFVAIGGNEQPDKQPKDIVSQQVATYTNQAKSGVESLRQQVEDNANKGIIDPSKRVAITTADVENMITGSYHGPVKNPIGPELKSTVSSILESRRQAGLNAAVLNSASQQMKNDPEMQKIDEEINRDLSQKSPVSIKDNNGKLVTYSPREIFDYIARFKEKQTAALAGTPIEFSNKEKLLDEKLGVSKFVGSGTNWAAKLLSLGIGRGEYDDVIHKDAEKQTVYNRKFNDLIATKTPEYAPKLSYVITPSETSKAKWESIANGLSSMDSHDRGGYDNWDNSKVKGWLANPKESSGLKYGIYNDGIIKQLWVTGPDGSTQKRTLSGTDIGQIPEAQTTFESQIKGDMKKTGGTTNASSSEDPSGARWQSTAFPRIKKATVVADLRQDTNDNSVVFPKLQVQLSDGHWLPIQIEKPMSINNANEFLRSLDDASIQTIIRNYYPKFNGKLF